MTDKEYGSQSYRMAKSAGTQAPEEDFFDRDAAYESWEEQSGSGRTGFGRYWVLLALLVFALIGIYLIYNAMRPRENTIRLSQTTVMDSRIDELEMRIAQLEDAVAETKKTAYMKDSSEVVDRLSGRIDRLENSFKTWVEEIVAKKEAVKEKPVTQAKPKKQVAPAKKKPAVVVKKETPKPAPTVKKEPPKPAFGTGRFHTVMPEENLYRISLKYNLSVDRLKELNNMTTNTIRTGQKLRVSP